MKKKIFGLGLLLVALLAATACGGSDEKKKTIAGKNAGIQTPAVMPNYRFINFDTICDKYNLAIDFKEQMMRMQNNLDAEEKKLGTTFQTRYNSFMQKQEALQQERVQLPSEIDALKKEGESLQSYYQQSQENLMKLQLQIDQTRENNLNAIMDSIQSFCGPYAIANGYDAVLFSNGLPYSNPALDVTDEVVEGLNARYNNVKK